MFWKELKKWITKQTLVLCNYSPKNKLSITILLSFSLSLSHLDRCSHSLHLRSRSKFNLRSKSIHASSTSTSNLSARRSFSLSSSSFQLRPWTNSLPPPRGDLSLPNTFPREKTKTIRSKLSIERLHLKSFSPRRLLAHLILLRIFNSDGIQ